MSFTRLSINRDLIDNCINDFIGEGGRVTIQAKPNNLFVYIIETPQQAKALLNIHHNIDGTTTLQPKVGANQSFSLSIAEQVKASCCFDEVKTNGFYFNDLTQDEYDTVIDYLVEECNSEVLSETTIPHGKQKKLKSKQGDRLSFNYYHNKKSLYIQGAPMLLFYDTIDILSQLFPDKYKVIIEQQLKYYDVDLTPEDIISELDNRIPSAVSKIDSVIKLVISPSLALTKIQINLPDYTSFVSPVLKGLEGVLKQIFAENDIHITRDGFGEHFEFNYRNSKHHLNEDAKKKITNPKLQHALAEAYNYYVAKRHPSMHMDGVVATTPIISRVDADIIIDTALNIIENVFVALNS